MVKTSNFSGESSKLMSQSAFVGFSIFTKKFGCCSALNVGAPGRAVTRRSASEQESFFSSLFSSLSSSLSLSLSFSDAFSSSESLGSVPFGGSGELVISCCSEVVMAVSVDAVFSESPPPLTRLIKAQITPITTTKITTAAIRRRIYTSRGNGRLLSSSVTQLMLRAAR